MCAHAVRLNVFMLMAKTTEKGGGLNRSIMNANIYLSPFPPLLFILFLFWGANSQLNIEHFFEEIWSAVCRAAISNIN